MPSVRIALCVAFDQDDDGAKRLIPNVRYPVRVRLTTTDVSVLHHVFVDREYDCELAITPKTIIDAGANIGLTSIFYSNKYPEAKIVAVEPELSNFQLLSKNVSSYPQITAIRAALWSHDTTLNVVDRGFGNQGFETTAQGNGGNLSLRCQAPGIAIGDLMRKCNLDWIDLLKIDIEGAEKEVFESPEPWITQVGCIAVELHDRFKAGCSRAFYRATNDFSVEWRKNETTFVARKSYIPKGPPEIDALTFGDIACAPLLPKPQFRLV